MALNKLMHHRNPYKSKKPDFKTLAAKYNFFRKNSIQDSKGNVHLDFKKPECLRALSCALLKDDFDLDVEMPLDRLIPTIPLRLNYILWLEDVLQSDGACKDTTVRGIDIGAGASCVYPLLAAKKNGWCILASETDPTNFEYAQRNVMQNNLQHLITVVKPSDPSSMLCELLENSETCYDFCMCNPPFYGSNLEAWGLTTSRSESRPTPSSVNTASPQESVVPGGEVQFVKHMIADSLILGRRVRVYTSMLGKKSSLSVLKAELARNKITHIGTTELCQGRTMRWVLAWTFDDTVKFPKPPSKLLLSQKPPPPLVWTIPKDCPMVEECSVEGVTHVLTQLLTQLKISQEVEEQSSTCAKWRLTAQENTWSHQRRQRREKQRANKQQETPAFGNTLDNATDPPDGTKSNAFRGKREKAESISDDESEPKTKSPKQEMCGPGSGSHDLPSKEKDKSPSGENMDKDVIVNNPHETRLVFSELDEELNFLFQAQMSIKQSEDKVIVELQWLDGQSKELLHQVLQYIKNKFK